MTLRPLLRPLVRDPLRPITDRRGGWSPFTLFAAGEQGGWWDPSDFSTMFQDSAGTTPVTAVGQPVGLIRDKSGNGNHFSQSTTTNRPALRQDAGGFFYLDFDGVDDGLSTQPVNFAITDKINVIAGAMKTSDAAIGVLLELSTDSSATSGTFAVIAPTAVSANNWMFRSRGTIVSNATSGATFASPSSSVISCQGDIANDIAILRINGVQAASSVTDQGTGTLSATQTLNWGARGGGASNRFSGRGYQLIVRGATGTLMTAAQLARAETFTGARMGIAL